MYTVCIQCVYTSVCCRNPLTNITDDVTVAPLFLLQYNELVDKVTSSETKVSEMETTVEDLQWDMEKLRNREQKLNKHLAEAMEQVRLTYLCAFSIPCFFP